jgi:uncharacterized membrane protein
MNGNHPRLLPISGCVGVALTLFFLCLMPLVLVDTMQTAMENLQLSRRAALVTVIGILAGSLINIPVYRIHKHEAQVVDTAGVLGLWGFAPQLRRVRRDSIVAVNVGGCVVPVALAVWESLRVVGEGGWPLYALLIVSAVNIIVCYRVALPVKGVGIAMPGLISPLVAICLSWLLLLRGEYDEIRAPVAFIAGVVGPLVGADLLHLKDITKISAGIFSIGGAGTFDGIVLSGVLAALLT